MPTIYQLLESGLHFSYLSPWSPHPPGSSPLFSEVRTRKIRRDQELFRPGNTPDSRPLYLRSLTFIH